MHSWVPSNFCQYPAQAVLEDQEPEKGDTMKREFQYWPRCPKCNSEIYFQENGVPKCLKCKVDVIITVKKKEEKNPEPEKED